jgi:phosphoribosylaminoimidazole-succinocarboxamide synthase
VADQPAPHLRLLHSGKVRDLYLLPDGDLLMVASDRISAFDWVLPTLIPDKGRILTALSVWWFDRLADLVDHHVRSTQLPPGADPAWAGRALVCERLSMYPVECVVRGWLTGSGLADYRRTGHVCGINLPPGLVDGSRLPDPIFTPATKAPAGAHDENISYDELVARVGAAPAEALRATSLAVYRRLAGLAEPGGIIVADTKLEFGGRADGTLVLADEVGTPDSSRFWPATGWRPGRAPASYDKQFVRDWLTSPASGWSRESGDPPPPLPDAVVEATRSRYVEAYERITGRRWA